MVSYHIPVLLRESIAFLDIRPEGTYLDATFGGGGHSRAVLEKLGPKGRLLAFDQDARTAANIPDDKRITWIHSNFRFIHQVCKHRNIPAVDGILADLGVSWHQFDTPERGFSFRFDAPLDMRMNLSSDRTAAVILNEYAQEDLTRLFRVYGGLSHAGAIADAIVKARTRAPVTTVSDLRNALERFIPRTGEHKFLAKTYQALRIEVNNELKALEGFLNQSIPLLRPGGRLVVISYHSLEDKTVKHFMKDAVREGRLEAVIKKPIVPTEEEIAQNTRARSAKLRAAEKKEEAHA